MAKKKRKQSRPVEMMGSQGQLQQIDTVIVPNAPIPSPSVGKTAVAQLLQALNQLGTAMSSFARN